MGSKAVHENGARSDKRVLEEAQPPVASVPGEKRRVRLGRTDAQVWCALVAAQRENGGRPLSSEKARVIVLENSSNKSNPNTTLYRLKKRQAIARDDDRRTGKATIALVDGIEVWAVHGGKETLVTPGEFKARPRTPPPKRERRKMADEHSPSVVPAVLERYYLLLLADSSLAAGGAFTAREIAPILDAGGVKRRLHEVVYDLRLRQLLEVVGGKRADQHGPRRFRLVLRKYQRKASGELVSPVALAAAMTAEKTLLSAAPAPTSLSRLEIEGKVKALNAQIDAANQPYHDWFDEDRRLLQQIEELSAQLKAVRANHAAHQPAPAQVDIKTLTERRDRARLALEKWDELIALLPSKSI